MTKPVLLGFAAYSGTGKTSLLEKLIPLFKLKGLRIALVKHAHHDFEIDYPGKDSYRLRKAGSIETLVASNKRWALIHEQQDSVSEPDLFELIKHLNTQQLDLILVEGFKHEAIPRIELHRKILKKDYLYPNDKQIIAIATDLPNETFTDITVLDINNPQQIIEFILKELNHYD